MVDPATARRDFLAAQVTSLEPLDFVVVGVPRPPFDELQVRREEDGSLAVEIADREASTPFPDAATAALASLGFSHGEATWTCASAPADAEGAAALADRILAEVFATEAGTQLDVRHGTLKPEREAEQKLAEMRTRIEPVLAGLLGAPAPTDDDGDYVVDLGASRVFVAPRAMPGAPPIVRVFAITNAGVTITPELGLFLTRLNFSLTFGRFSLDADHQAIWFDETLLGEHLTDDELRFMVEMVAATADDWDDRIAQMFGGRIRAPEGSSAGDSATTSTTPNKPGQGGYL
ncbi:MAG TPA: YbjN domain-containing protein [Acidimicrobiales bacterium]|nr:YbjN domain-containing protein [Acidimicrobiales bacterium]